jgi:hypothetical protein
MANIIWLASYPRSGNVWLQSFLHNLICDARQAPNAEAIVGFCTPEPAAVHFLGPDSAPLGSWTREEAAARRAQAHKAIAGLRDSDNVFASTQAALVESGGFPTITMHLTAGAIYMVRNPLDLAVSMAAYGGQEIDEAIMRLEAEYQSENSDKFAYEFQGSWSNHVMSWTQQRHAGLHFMRYEDMISAPVSAFGPLVTFLGLDIPPERIARAIHLSSFAELAAKEEQITRVGRSGQPGKIFRAGTADQWRDVLSDQQVRRIVNRHAKQMERFGYIPDGY